MSVLSELYMKIETLETLVATLKAKELKGISLTVGISDESNTYGQNLTAYVSQTKEERDAQKARYYVGNGKVFWTDGTIKLGSKDQSNTPSEQIKASEFNDSKLPF